jgi:hypothetical protein
MKRTILQTALTLALPAVALSGCYIVPVGPEEIAKMHILMQQANQLPYPAAPQSSSQPPKPLPTTSNAPAATPPAATPPPASPKTAPIPLAALPARLYPVNEIATENGMVSGTVTSLADGKARFQLNYRGELLMGEATRVSGDDRKGVATAWGPTGSFMSCEYQMSTPARGAGTCSFSDGARYQVHVGN